MLQVGSGERLHTGEEGPSRNRRQRIKVLERPFELVSVQ